MKGCASRFFRLTLFFFFISGSALDINFSDINVASLEQDLEEQEDQVGFASRTTLNLTKRLDFEVHTMK